MNYRKFSVGDVCELQEVHSTESSINNYLLSCDHVHIDGEDCCILKSGAAGKVPTSNCQICEIVDFAD